MANLLNLPAITTAIASTTTTALKLLGAPRNLTIQCNFTYGSGGTQFDAYVQTSIDGGSTWIDVANFETTTANLKKVVNLYSGTPVTTAYTPTDGSLGANTVKDGILGTQLRVKYSSTGTYVATSCLIDVTSDQLT